jgi:hypothetical protein
MRVIYSYYIFDGAFLCKLVRVSDFGGLNVKYFQISTCLPQYNFIADSQYFEYTAFSVNISDENEWLSNGSGHLKYMKINNST